LFVVTILPKSISCNHGPTQCSSGVRGTYQHCSEKHLQRLSGEFDLRYNNRIAPGVDDEKRATELAKGMSASA
jgi:hypothetical protein